MRFGRELLLALLLLGFFNVPAFAQEDDHRSVRELLTAVQSLLNHGKYGQAADTYRKAVVKDDSSALGWQRLGYALHLDGQLDKAMEAHKRAAGFSDPEIKQLGLYNQACVYALKKDSDNAFMLLNLSLIHI